MNNYTELLPSEFASELSERREEYLSHWKAKGLEPAAEMAKIAAKDVTKRRGAYLTFGMYWWGLKKILLNAGAIPDSWNSDEPLIRREYVGKDDIDTLILAFIFKDKYNQSYFQGTREFALNFKGDTHVLFDEDIELSDFLR